jgi:hypothetical protein
MLGAVRDVAPSMREASQPEPAPSATPQEPTISAPVSTTILADTHVEELVAAGGLESRLADVAALAGRGLRLTHAGAVRAVRLGEGRGEPAAIAHVSLADLPGELELPREGVLSFYADLAAPLESSLTEIGCAVRLDARRSSDATATLAVSCELQLPRVWTAAVQDLGLTNEEQAAWAALRVRLAEAQGVQPFDLAPRHLALHRLLGLADETSGLMPELCAPDETERWRLLLQISRDDAIAWTAGWERSRLYFWVDRNALLDGDFSGVRAFRG